MYSVYITVYLVSVLSVATMMYIWNNRWYYYYTLRFPGSLFNPIYMCKLLLTMSEDLRKGLLHFYKLQPPVFKIWAPNQLFIVNSEPEDLEILLSTFLDKSFFYNMFEEMTGKNLGNIPVTIWKERRRESNRTFNVKIMASFHNNFIKYAKKLVENFDEMCGEEQTDLLPVVWKHLVDNSLENLGDIDPVLVKNRYEGLEYSTIGEKIIIERVRKFWLLVDFFFRHSSYRKKMDKLLEKCEIFRETVFAAKKVQMSIGLASDLRSKRFSNHMVNLYTSDKITKTEMINEIAFMLMAASETTTKALVFAILALGMHEEVQEKIYQEISSASKTSDGDVSVKDIDRMDYLERTIKEVLRMFPIITLIMRSIDKNFKLGSLTYPAGSHLMVPIDYIHRRPDLWPDPLKFDPDRFLPEEVAKRHRCAFMPFSFGPRNCIGYTYGLFSMKVNLAYIVNRFKIKTLNCQKLENLKINWHIVAEPAEYRVVFERRT